MELSALTDQPEYQLFRRAFAERKAPLVIVTGAGLSAPAGLPTWTSLRSRLQEEADRKTSALNQFGEALLGGKTEAARSQENIWVAFKLLKEVLSPPVFDQLVEQFLSPTEGAPIPRSYSDLLRLDPRGLVTLNLDKFAGEALAQRQSGELITPIFGKELAQKWNLLRASKTYLVYLHGGLHDPATWVLTQDDLSEITSSEGHAHFLKTLLTENLVLFVGVGVDDLALSGRLIDLRNAGFRPSNLFWFTNRRDLDLRVWAADSYISLIRYNAVTNEDHERWVGLFVDNCLGFVSKDDPQPPLTGSGGQFALQSKDEPLDPDELAQKSPEEIRKTIASRLDEILLNEDDQRSLYEKYREFCSEYDFAVHRAFYRGKGEKFRDWFGYRLNFPSLGRGNFGEVYSANTSSGAVVAVKIMHESIFGNNDMLGGFRRGVRSMRIVTDHLIEGMVPIIESFELPPTIIMPYVDGQSLQDALEIRSDLPWLLKLDVVIKIGQVVMAGHALPQTILHRDLKPSNIMISNFEYEGSFVPDVTVLDFDMSWHKGSKEKDVIFESRDDFGFLAPEQTDSTNRYAARSTRVDAYGYGMTIYYTFGRVAPRPNEALSEHWLSLATTAAAAGYKEKWRSGPNRLARIIAHGTEIDQNSRTDFATMVHGLEFLMVAIRNSTELISPDLWAEEVLANSIDEQPYRWDDAFGSGGFETASGIEIRCAGNFRAGSVRLEIGYADRGVQERGQLSRYLPTAAANAQKALSDGGWGSIERRSGGMEASIRAEVPVSRLQNSPDAALKAAAAAVQYFVF